MENSLEGKVALVTGASAGIGQAIAVKLAALGCKLVLNGRDGERLRGSAMRIGADADAVAVEADLAVPHDVEKLARQAIDAFGRIDVLVANAGTFSNRPFTDDDVDTARRMIDVNFASVVHLARIVLPYMQRQGSGDVLAIGSIAGVADMRNEAVYSATKHALNAFIRSLRRQVAADGVRVTSILPGSVATDIWGIRDPDRIEELVGAREILTVEDIAEIAAFVLLQPPHVTIRELVVLPQAQDV